jgi:putative DNA-invertase from lambdoid prophage Rac
MSDDIPTKPSRKRAAIYCRVSTSDQRCERQELDLLAYADRAGLDVIGVFKETVSGAKTSREDRSERAKVLDLARQRHIEVILVTELTRWGRSTQDLVATFNDLQAWGVSLIAQTGLQLDMSTAQGKLIATLMATLAEFERDLMRERIRSGVHAAKARGVQIGRQKGFMPVQRRKGAQIIAMRNAKHSIRAIASGLGVSPGTVQRVLKRGKALLD